MELTEFIRKLSEKSEEVAGKALLILFESMKIEKDQKNIVVRNMELSEIIRKLSEKSEEAAELGLWILIKSMKTEQDKRNIREALVEIEDLGYEDLYNEVENFIEKEKVAENLAKLAKSSCGDIRYFVGFNENTPVEVLRILAKDLWAEPAVSCNPNTPKEVLSEMSHSDDSIVRRNVADNESTPLDVVRRLLEDEDEEVREYALYNLENKQMNTDNE